jgi:hypothetical protein
MGDDSERPDDWPTYHSAPKEATYALGVIGTAYGRLEFAFGGLFANTLGLAFNFTSMLLPKITNDVRIALIEEALPQSDFDAETQDHIRHFITGFRNLVFNRNMLMHSQIIAGGATASILLRTQRDGSTVGCSVTVTQLRQIADDMEAYRSYGIALGNCVGLPRVMRVFAVGTPPPPELSRLPGKPALPSRLEYTSDPIPHR